MTAAQVTVDGEMLDRQDGQSRPPVRLVEAMGLEQILPHVQAWQGLVANALEPNVFYEPAFLTTLLRHFPQDQSFRILFVYRDRSDEVDELTAVFPLTRERRGPGRTLWRHQNFWNVYIGLCTPLVHRAFGGEAIDALLDWLDRRPNRTAVLGLQWIGVEGPFWTLLWERIGQRDQPCFIRKLHERAVLRPGPSAAHYLRTSLSAKRRKEFKRLRKRLFERGEVRLELLRAGQDPEPWIEDFLRLEASGWKGAAGTAFANADADADFFRDVLRQSHRDGTLLMQAFSLDGRRIAMKCSLRASGGEGGAFAFKIAYDEGLARFSPGVLLELETVRLFHEDPDYPPWMDSCAEPDHPMIDRLWSDRRRIGYILCAARRWRYRVLFGLLAAIPGLNRAERLYRDRKGEP